MPALTRNGTDRAMTSAPRAGQGATVTRAPEARVPSPSEPASTARVRDSSRVRSKSDSACPAASTNQASSGPESRARPTPPIAAATMNTATCRPNPNARLWSARRSPAAISTGRRPRTSARPPVGSSKNAVVAPTTANTTPMAVTLSPRACMTSTNTGSWSPVWKQRNPSSARNRRRRRGHSLPIAPCVHSSTSACTIRPSHLPTRAVHQWHGRADAPRRHATRSPVG